MFLVLLGKYVLLLGIQFAYASKPCMDFTHLSCMVIEAYLLFVYRKGHLTSPDIST